MYCYDYWIDAYEVNYVSSKFEIQNHYLCSYKNGSSKIVNFPVLISISILIYLNW